jgi:hypothetical protein
VTVEWAQAATIVSALAAFTALQAFWISRALDRVYVTLDRLETRLDRLETRLDRLETRLGRVEVALRDLGERVAHLEAARTD